MTFRKFALGLVALGALSVAGSALADPIATRQQIMKSVGAAAKVSGAMAKGEMDFNPDVAMAALTTFAAAGQSFTAFFPAGSETGGNTRARDTIWSDNAGFIAANDTFAKAAVDAAAAKPGDLDAFKVAFGSVAQTCSTCHEGYRIANN